VPKGTFEFYRDKTLNMYYFIARFKILRQYNPQIKQVGIAVPLPKKAETR